MSPCQPPGQVVQDLVRGTLVGGQGGAAGLAAGATVLRAGYSALEPVRALIRSRLDSFDS